MTPLLIHRKLPVTARTAGRCDRPEAPTAPPAFILLFLSSSVKSPGWGESAPRNGGTAAHVGLGLFGRGQGLCPSHDRGTQRLTRPNRGYGCVCPLPAWPRAASPCQRHRDPRDRQSCFFLSVFGLWPQSGSGLLSERYVGGCLWETERSSPLIGNPRSICRLWPKTGGVVLGIPKGQLRRLRLGLPHRRPDHTDQRGELRSVGGRDALMQVLRQFQDHGL